MGEIVRPDWATRRDWYRVERNAAEDAATIYLYGAVGMEENDARDFAQELDSITEETINLRLNSPGGDVFSGVAIYNALAAHPSTVNVYVDGLAASAASFIAMAGDSIVMQPHSRMMIHDAAIMKIAMGVYNAADLKAEIAEMEQLVTRLDEASDNIANIYAERAGGSPEEWRERMRAESWFSDKQAVELGLANAIGRPNGKDAEREAARFDLSSYQHVPERLVALHQEMAEAEPEQLTAEEVAAVRELLAAREEEAVGGGDAPGQGEEPTSVIEARKRDVDAYLKRIGV